MADKMLRIKLVRSPIGYNRKQRLNAEALGLRKMNAVVVRKDTPTVRGMVNKIIHLVEVEEIEE